MLIFQTRCSSERSHKLQVREYEEVMLKGSKSIYDFFMKLEPDSAYLDSALMYLNTAAKYECAKHPAAPFEAGSEFKKLSPQEDKAMLDAKTAATV